MKRHNGHEREIPNAHNYHTLIPIIFGVIWVLVSFLFKFSIFLNNYIPFIIRLSSYIIILGIGLILIHLSHTLLFKSHKPPDRLIIDGRFKYTRNPMYLGILLIYVACVILSISLIAAAILPLIFLVYNKMANFEEKILDQIFGDRFSEYKEIVPKWIFK